MYLFVQRESVSDISVLTLAVTMKRRIQKKTLVTSSTSESKNVGYLNHRTAWRSDY